MKHALKFTVMAGITAAALMPVAFSAPASAEAPIAIRGIVESIDGEDVTFKQPWGETVVVNVTEYRQKMYGVEVGDDFAVTLQRGTDELIAARLCPNVEATTFAVAQAIEVPAIDTTPRSAPALPPRTMTPAPAPAPAPIPALW